LHRRTHRQPAFRPEVFTHADLLTVEQHGRAGQREQQAIDHPNAVLVAAEHRRQPPAQAAAVELHLWIRPERLEHFPALRVGELVQRQLVVVTDERRPVRVLRRLRPLA
jgi:hypothetical protein